jgi:glycosyltransferase involved in cell wall biosynthesis
MQHPESMHEVSHIFHVTDDFSPESGVAGMINQLSRYLKERSWATTILTGEGQVGPVTLGVTCMTFPLAAGGFWQFPRGFKSYLQSLATLSGPKLHLHGIWMGFQWLAARVASQEKIPVLLSPHGMLNSWHRKQLGFKVLKKMIYWHSIAYPVFRQVQKIHAVTPLERDELAHWFPGQDIEVIPNAIDLEAMDHLLANAGAELAPVFDGPYILFLGRLHPVKGIELLIEAFSLCLNAQKNSQFRLVIAGPESDPSYTARLKSQVRLLGLEDKVAFTGPRFGTQKMALYHHAWAFCAPSQTEVMGLVNLEAASAGTPVITTHETGLCGWEEGGGVLVHPQVEDLSRALRQVCSWSASERRDRGQKLRQLVEQRYSWQAVGPQWLELYEALV